MATSNKEFWIRPQAALAGTTIPLPPADQAGQRSIVPRVLCFLTDHHFDEDRFVIAVQNAIAGSVDEVPMLAGRVEWENEKASRVKVKFSEDPGVELRVNHLPHLDAKQMDAAHWPPHSLPFLDLCLVHRGMSFLNYVFAVKVTLIKGGVIIVLHINHTVSDGTSNGHIQGLFVEHMARSLNGEIPRPSGRFPPGSQDRSKVFGSQPAKSIELWQDWQDIKNVITPKPEPLALTVWYMPPEKMQQLRKLPSSVDAQTRLSTAHTLAAFLWRAVTRARRQRGDQLTTLLTPVQVRGVAGMSPNYCGNCLTYGRAKVTVSELLSQPLAQHVLRIDRSCKWWTAEAVRELWGSIDNVPNLANIKPNTFRDYGSDFEVSNLMNVPFFQLDWGRGLHIRAFRWPGLALADGWVNVLPRLPNGGLEIILHSTRSVLDNLLRDVQFTEYLQYRTSGDKAIDEQVRTAAVPRAQL